MNHLMELVLAHRGLTEADLAAFEDPRRGELKDVDALCGRLAEIRRMHKKITVIPDFDMDGIMSGTVGYAGLSELGFDAELFIPNPSEKYGFRAEQIDRLLKEHPGTEVIITCDTGIGCAEGAEYAVSKGIEVLITDHHLEKENASARKWATVTVDPYAVDEDYEHPDICGAHVLWQCLYRFATLYGGAKDVERIWKLRIFAGVGTISDVMPVLYENRKLIRDAIDITRETWTAGKPFKDFLDGASEPYTHAFRGLYAAIKSLSNAGKLHGGPDDLNEEAFGFQLSPVFNSVKRLDGDMSRAFGVFFGDNQFDDMRYLIDLNEERKRIANQKFEELLTGEHAYAPYCYISDAPAGILGLLATKMLSETGYPCVVVAQNKNGTFSGSGRSPKWYPFNSRTSAEGFRVSGHEGAFGCGFGGTDDLDRLYKFLCEDVEKERELHADELVEDIDFTISPDGFGDVGIDPEMFLEFADELDQYRPFGSGFEAPKVLVDFDAKDASWFTMGKENAHLKAILPMGFEVICWNDGHRLANGNKPEGRIQVSGKISVNTYMGLRKAQFSGNFVESA